MINYRYSKQAEKFFKTHQNIKEKFKRNIESVYLLNNKNVDIKLLKGSKDILRMRINDYRIIYRVEENGTIIIDVVLAGNRGEIYKKYSK